MTMKGWRAFAAAWRLKVVAALLLAVVGALIWQRQTHDTPQGMADPSRLEILHARCVQDMVANTCKVMGAVAAPETAKPGDLVFVAGVGPIDAVAYQQMYAAGAEMCSVVRKACSTNWSSAQCLTARTLYQP